MSPKPLDLTPDVLALLAAGRGAVTAAEAAVAGVGRSRLCRLADAGLLERVGVGAYASSEELATASPWTAHAIRTRGFLRSRRVGAYAAGWSGVAVCGLPAIGQPPKLPLAVQPTSSRDGGSARLRVRRTRYGIVRETTLPVTYRAWSDGCPIVDPAWLVVDLAREAARPGALVVADAVLNENMARKGDLGDALGHLSGWSGSSQAAWVVRHADGGAESALESLGRLAFIEHGLPVPLSNVWVGADGPRYRVDHLLPWHWLAFEADGALKYRNAEDPAVVAAEKGREAYLRRQVGLDVVRYDWRQAGNDRGRLAGAFRQVIAANPERPTPVRWWPAPPTPTHVASRHRNVRLCVHD